MQPHCIPNSRQFISTRTPSDPSSFTMSAVARSLGAARVAARSVQATKPAARFVSTQGRPFPLHRPQPPAPIMTIAIIIITMAP